MSYVLAYLAALMVSSWGVLHAIPTSRVVAGFGIITTDNRYVITQEWLAEGSPCGSLQFSSFSSPQ